MFQFYFLQISSSVTPVVHHAAIAAPVATAYAAPVVHHAGKHFVLMLF